ncbi:hypothetical protein GWI33_015005 [Rhynchophorus ferrugineus]|uniref:Uncharacterized protein n=1 Tax=Rhynchophorus ferrugineus TaxID=354439 RepID=A0A834I4Q6_RHYFE|nr:hypothetical protein GWI33_015005 [Rhynchophorus ferrugineus]
MAQFVTHIQPTLIEASHHHIPHPHHHKEHHEKYHKESGDHQQGSKDHHAKEKHGSKAHTPKMRDAHGHSSSQSFPVLPPTPGHPHHDDRGEHRPDSGLYLDSHGFPHTYQLHFIDSQGIHRDFHGHVEESLEKEPSDHEHDKEYQHETDSVFEKAVHEDRSPFEKSLSREERRPTPPQFINLPSVHAVENKHQTVSIIDC